MKYDKCLECGEVMPDTYIHDEVCESCLLDAVEPKPYRPSNGTEGDIFMGCYCRCCARDVKEDCPILFRSLAYNIDHEHYPVEWVYGEDGEATCTAFEPKAEELQDYKPKKPVQISMFPAGEDLPLFQHREE